MKKLIFLLIIVLLVSGCEQEQERLLSSAMVLEVIDGDTLVLEDGTNIRLLHINAPEKNENCFDEAKTRLKQLVLGKQVWLERDKEDYDQYDRSLRYVFLYENKNSQDTGGLVNLMLLQEGLVKLYVVGTNTKYEQVFRNEFNQIQSGCLFQKSQASNCFSILEFHYDAEGNDCSNNNDEYVTLVNVCDDIDMQNWQIKDAARHVYTFGDFVARKDTSFTLYTGKGQDTSSELYWQRSCSVWNNDHDTLYLYDDSSNLVLEFNY
jgi:endonuclease YncB( thermonuclease family)